MNKTIDTISSTTMDALSRYHWPGNIRELQNVIERAVITSTGPVLKVDVADLKISKPSSPAEKGSAQGSTNGRSEEHTSELQADSDIVCRLLLEKKNKKSSEFFCT